ncbi:MAG TPA: ATP-binding protein [Gemmataceae bacterium]|nr:ATP-binding protein [Gemmataceae bacterium]
MLFGLLRYLPPALRFRLTFWNTIVILVLVGGALWGVREGVRWTLLGELDSMLGEDVKEVQLTIDRYGLNWDVVAAYLAPKIVSNSDRGWFVRIFSESFELLWSSPDAPELNVSKSRMSKPGAFSRLNYRLMQLTLPAGKRTPPLIIRVGVQQDQVDDDVRRLSEWMLTAFTIILVAAPLSGYWLAGRAIRPLATILNMTGRLHPDNLSERLPLRGSGDELDQLSATLNGMLDRLASHLEQQRTFVANAAHELRSPLTAMRTTLEVALERERSPAEYRELYADLIEECTSLGNLIKHLLLLAEGDAGLLHADGEVRLDELVQRSADMFQGIAEQRGVSLRVHLPQAVVIRGNCVHLREVIHNLLDNALKFTPEGGSVSVELNAAPGSPQAQLSVRDTGEGIPPEDLPKVFQRFYRADKSRQRTQAGGSGLGLSICQAVVHAYGGQISIASTLGKGTTVTVALPACASSSSLAITQEPR